jgi:hypothetical protein
LPLSQVESAQRSFEAIAAMEAAAKLLQSDPGLEAWVSTSVEPGGEVVKRLSLSAIPTLMQVLCSGGIPPADTAAVSEQQQQQLEACCVLPPHLFPLLAPACYRVLTGLVSLLLHDREVNHQPIVPPMPPVHVLMPPEQQLVVDAWIKATCLIADWTPTHHSAGALMRAAMEGGAAVPGLEDHPDGLALDLRLAALSVRMRETRGRREVGGGGGEEGIGKDLDGYGLPAERMEGLAVADARAACMQEQPFLGAGPSDLTGQYM